MFNSLCRMEKALRFKEVLQEVRAGMRMRGAGAGELRFGENQGETMFCTGKIGRKERRAGERNADVAQQLQRTALKRQRPGAEGEGRKKEERTRRGEKTYGSRREAQTPGKSRG